MRYIVDRDRFERFQLGRQFRCAFCPVAGRAAPIMFSKEDCRRCCLEEAQENESGEAQERPGEA